ncbi:MAG: hypothetical protein NC229_08485 [Bacteroides sp.]|nr:hypothetical protein [Bacteroidales bacterium]MCM1068719.1 hypothetical protein [Prevotella sp.]MCM1354681.1 hypothetical protein [Bacteroides sp.]MCM1403771.1 hypothetical protein [Bacteroides sp.]MCM1443511.1 hypothetical protein [Muribaculum sp.]
MPITLTGFAQATIKNLNLVAKQNDPQLKLTPTGFLRLLLENNAVTEINNLEALRKGLKRDIKLRYLQRGLESDVTDIDDCETPLGADWKEHKITNPLFSKIGIFISDDEFRQYEDEAIQTLALGDSQQAPLMRGFYEVLLTKLIGLIGKIDSNLIAAQATKWGANAAYELSTTAQMLKLGKSADFNTGYVKLMEDAIINEVNDSLLICGNGLVTRYDIFHKLKTNPDSQGISALPLNAYYDPRTITGWGKDHFGAFAKGTIGFVDWNRYVGAFAGEKAGSVFFTLPVPVELDGALTSLVFDCQLKYEDCPIYGSDGGIVQARGWKLIVSKNYGLFNAPTDSFQNNDVLRGVNGSFHYVATSDEQE